MSCLEWNLGIGLPLFQVQRETVTRNEALTRPASMDASLAEKRTVLGCRGVCDLLNQLDWYQQHVKGKFGSMSKGSSSSAGSAHGDCMVLAAVEGLSSSKILSLHCQSDVAASCISRPGESDLTRLSI